MPLALLTGHFVFSSNIDHIIVRLCVILCLVKVKPEVKQVHDILMNFVHIFGRDLMMNSIESAVLILLTVGGLEVVEILRLYHQLGMLNVN